MDIVVTENESGQRLDRLCRKFFKKTPEVGLGDIFSWIRKGAIKVNGRKRKSDYRVQVGDQIVRFDNIETDKSALKVTMTKKEKVADMSIETIQEHIIFEDTNWLVFNKPVGVVVHPGNKHTTDITMNDMLLSYLQQTGQRPESDTFIPSFCFRLDKDTTGVLIGAKNFLALQTLNELIRDRKTSKEYRAIVGGNLHKAVINDKPLFVGFDKKSGKGKTFINAERGKEAESQLRPIHHGYDEEIGEYTMIGVKIITGRMHQIRIHAADCGHPIIGDLTYGNPVLNRRAKKSLLVNRQLLHCYIYGFYDPISNKQVSFTAPLPNDFYQFSS